MSRPGLQVTLGTMVLITLALAPVKFLTIDVAGADLTAFRIALLATSLVAVVLATLDREYRACVLRYVRTRFFLASAAFTAWVCISAAHGYLSAPTGAFERRAIIGAGSLVLTVLILPLIAVPALVRLRALTRVLAVPARVWQLLLAFAFVQVGLHLVGLPVNGIELGVPPTYPVAPFFGLELLRPYSIVGEPRDLASMAIPLLVAGVVLVGHGRLTLRHGLALGVLGVLLASFTFYLALLLFAVYYMVIERRSALIEPRAAVVAIALVIAAPLVSAAIDPGGTRVLTELDNIGTPAVTEPTETEPIPTAAFNQAPDLLAADYARDAVTGDIGFADLLFGTGIGSFTATINRYYIEQFDFDLVRGGWLVNSRLLPFGLLVEAGLLALVLLAWVLWEALRELQRSLLAPIQRARVRVVLVGFVLASVVQTSILFGVGLVIALALAWHDEPGAEGA